jgi:hypothetical protein
MIVELWRGMDGRCSFIRRGSSARPHRRALLQASIVCDAFPDDRAARRALLSLDFRGVGELPVIGRLEDDRLVILAAPAPRLAAYDAQAQPTEAA